MIFVCDNEVGRKARIRATGGRRECGSRNYLGFGDKGRSCRTRLVDTALMETAVG